MTSEARGYQGAGNGRVMRGWPVDDASADSIIDVDLAELRNRSNDAYRNIPIATSAIRTPATSVVGSGLTLQSRIDRKVYRIKELAGIVGISSAAFSERLRNHGWEYPEILLREIPRGKRSKENLLNTLSNRVRSENLCKISEPTDYELNL